MCGEGLIARAIIGRQSLTKFWNFVMGVGFPKKSNLLEKLAQQEVTSGICFFASALPKNVRKIKHFHENFHENPRVTASFFLLIMRTVQ